MCDQNTPSFLKYQIKVKNNNFITNKKYYKHIQEIKSIFNDLILGNKLNYSKILDLCDSIYSSIDYGLDTCLVLKELYSIDDCTYIHSINTAIYSMQISRWLGLPTREIKNVIQSGLLHDIGKTKVPFEILNKEGFLNEEEKQVIQTHSVYGYRIVDEIPRIDPEVKQAILLHHERMDGSGYPYNYKDSSIGVYARIVAVADVFDAMTSDRVYKKGVTLGEAIKTLETVGFSLFDKRILEVFLKNINEFLFTKY